MASTNRDRRIQQTNPEHQVLSIGKMVAGSEDYYLNTVAAGREEYYTGAGEAPGQWLGSGTTELGLSGEVAPDHLRSVLAGHAPDGRPLTAGRVRPDGRVSGFDLTYSAPKSVSLLYGLSDPTTSEVVRRAHADAVADALGYLERRGLRLRRGAGGERRIPASGFIAAAFQHRTSRSGDPQLHTHVLVANAALGVDDTWSAPDARLLYFHARTAGFLYQAALRADLTQALGVRFGPVANGTAELAGVSPVLLRAFSTRRAEIERHMEAAGTTSARAAEVAALITRAPKDGESGLDLDPAPTLRQRWQARAEDLGLSYPSLATTLSLSHQAGWEDPDIDAIITSLTGPEGLCAQDSSFERRDVVRAVAGGLSDGAPVGKVGEIADQVLSSPDVIPLAAVGHGGELLHTTTELLAIEETLLDRATRGLHAQIAVVSDELVGAALDRFPMLADEQQAMVRQLTTSGAGVEAVVGKAGSGKTTALAASRETWAAAGYRVRGVALSAQAADGLSDGSGIPSSTIARFVCDLDQGRTAIRTGDVLVIDEAGMVGTRQLGRLIGDGANAGAKVVLVGDPRQLPEIEAGGAFAGLIERIGSVELHENRRQDHAWERVALDELRHGNPTRGLAAFDGAQRIHVGSSMAEARGQLVEAWWSARQSGSPPAMLAVNRRDVDALNQLARAVLRREDSLGPDALVVDSLGFALDDEVLCLRNDHDLRVTNGTRGVITAANSDSLTLATDRGVRRLPVEYISDGHLTHGYATTIHKAQGATVDRAFVLATDALTREAGYVAMSRARRGTELFVPTSVFEDGVPLPDREKEATNPLHAVEKRFFVSRAKDMAANQQPERHPAADHPSGARSNSPHRDDGAVGLVRGEDSFPDVDVTSDSLDPMLEPEVRYLGPVMGKRPLYLDERQDYDRLARAITDYRRRYEITGDDALGPRPFAALQRSAYESVLADLRQYQRRLGRSLELNPPEYYRGR
jgi:conjugative relaxase-like TrwC/TraI family protein